MNISAPFIARPVATILLTLGIACSGAAAFTLLPVAPLPRIDLPAIFVTAALPGASPEVMASSIATPLERHLGAIADVDDLTSTSTVGSTNIQLTFGTGRDINGAARDVQAAIEAARQDLPSSLTRNPQYRQINTSQFPVLALALTSDVLTQGQIYDAADAVISQRLSQIDGVGAVNVNGSALPAVRVELNPLPLSRLGIGLQDVRAAISNANANAPKGSIQTGGLNYQIYTNDNARDAAGYRDLIIANRNGSTVRLSDVATVSDIQDGATENIRTYGVYNGKSAITVEVLQQPGANIIRTVDAVKAALPQLKAAIGKNIDMHVTFDRSIGIRASLRQVERTLLIAVAMVILVVYLFLHSWRSALVPAVVVPVSLIGTFGAMYLLDFTLDTFSLMAITIATGFVVDDAVVVMENIIRHIEAGKPRIRAALDASREVGFTVLAMSLALVAIFIPFDLASGIIGRISKEFAITLSASILISLAISLTMTPMMCSRLLGRGRHARGAAAAPSAPGARSAASTERPQRRFDAWFDRSFTRLRAAYERTLPIALARPVWVMLLIVPIFVFDIFLVIAVPKGFLPQEDTGQLRGGLRADSSASFDLIKSKLNQVTGIIQSDPAIESVTGTVGSGGFGPFGGGLSARINATLKPLKERKASADEVIDRLRPRLQRVSGIQAFLQVMQDIGGGGGGRSANSEYQYTLLGDDLNELRTWSDKLRVALQSVPELADVDTDVQAGGLEADLIVDRDTAYRLGLTEAQIDNSLGDAFAQAQVSTIYNPFSPQQYHVVMEVAPQFWQSPDTLKDLYVSTAGGAVTGTQATQAVAGTIQLKGAQVGSAGASTASAAAQDVARNAAANSLANAGRGNTSTGSAVSIARETMVPFSAFSHFATGTTPVSVNHTGVSASTSIAFNLPNGVSLDQALAAVQRTMDRIHVPVSIQGSTYGTAQLFQQESSSEPLILLAALIAVYVVLGVLYESYSYPLIIILPTVFSAALGALLALWITGTELGLVSFLGFLLLVGIIMKNAIMLIDFGVDAERRLGLPPRAAIAHACSIRFRPIMMTTGAALAAALVLALSHGAGTEMTRPLGIAMVGGLIVSQLLTLFMTPAVYLCLNSFAAWGARLVGRTPRPDLGDSGAGAGA
jgi:multidrug efflux pump